MIACRAIALVIPFAACAPFRDEGAPLPSLSALMPPPPPPAPPPPAAPPEPACAADADCGYAPAREACVADPAANRQPALLDQGIVCYCDEAARCATLRVLPTPCESDASCAVRLDPRPHPVAATPARPHERGRACRDFVFSTTCERTNICTMHRHACPGSPR